MQNRHYQFSACFKVFLISVFFLLLMKPADAKKSVFLPFSDTTNTGKSAMTNKSFLALGDSYTIGQSVDSSERFPAQTAAILKRNGYNISNIDYIATTGWKTVNLQWAIESIRYKRTYDVVTLLIGVNDQYLKKDTTGYREHFANLVQKAISFAGNNPSHVFVLSLPDYGVTPFGNHMKGVSKQINQFNAINKAVALSYGACYTNITGISRYDATDKTKLAWDDMHPSGKQYSQWALLLADKMMNVLR